MRETLHCDLSDHIKSRDVRGAYILLAVKAILMLTTIVLISRSVDNTKVKPCELQRALDFIHLEYTPHPCKYNAIKEKSTGLMILGITTLCWNAVSFAITKCLCLYESDEKKGPFFINYLIIIFGAVAFIIASLVLYTGAVNERETQPDTDYFQLKEKMISWLVQNYTSDNISSGDMISVAWNKFFIKYSCCAIREVQGTTNDFDNTPWCTESGSCQSTSSQIPKTCCKGVTLSNYQSAPAACHASVSPGTYNSNCLDRMKTLSVLNLDEYQVSSLILPVLILIVLQMFEVIIVLTLLLLLCCNTISRN